MVSAVDPDLATTSVNVRAGFMDASADSTKAGSTLSRITNRGKSFENAPCTGCGPRMPQSSAQAPRALPPMPTRHTVS